MNIIQEIIYKREKVFFIIYKIHFNCTCKFMGRSATGMTNAAECVSVKFIYFCLSSFGIGINDRKIKGLCSYVNLVLLIYVPAIFFCAV